MFHFKKNNVYLQPETQKEPRWCLFKACKFESCSGHKKRLMFASVFFCARRAPVSDPSPSPFQGRGVGRGAPDESVAMVTTGAGDFAILQ